MDDLAWELERLQIIWEVWRLPACVLIPTPLIFAHMVKDIWPPWRRRLYHAFAFLGLAFQAISLSAYLGERFLP